MAFVPKSRGLCRLASEDKSPDTSTPLTQLAIIGSDIGVTGTRTVEIDNSSGGALFAPGEDGLVLAPYLVGSGKSGTAYWNLYTLQAVVPLSRKNHDQVDMTAATGALAFIIDCVAYGTMTFDATDDFEIAATTALSSEFAEDVAMQFPGALTMTLTSSATSPVGNGSARFSCLAAPTVFTPGTGNGLMSQIYVPSFGPDVCGFVFQASYADQDVAGNALWAPLTLEV